jgi:integrase/recombinase XerC
MSERVTAVGFEFGARDRMSTADMVSRVFDLTDLRPSTRKTYTTAARGFVQWANGRTLHLMVLVEYKNYLRERTDLSAKTKNLYLAAVRTVFRQLFTWGVLPFDASRAVKAFAVSNGHKRSPISDAQVKLAFAHVRKSNDLRMALILNLLYRQGLRQKELVELEVEQFDEHAATIAVLGKGRDDRELINLHPETVRALKHFLEDRRLRAGFIFASRKTKGGHLTTNMLYKLVQGVHGECGISNSPHSWRKVFASKLIEAGLNLLDVQAFTRHKSVEQLKVYFDRISFRKSLPAYYEAFAV